MAPGRLARQSERDIGLAAYVPADRRRALASGVDLSLAASGTALFADLSGFLGLSEALLKAHGPHRGAEELTSTLNGATR